MITQPQPDEYGPFYANYVQLATAHGNNILQTLTQLKDSTYQLLAAIPPEKENYAYADGKWTIKQLLSHLIDAERIFAYRVLCFSRHDQNSLPGFDENDYVDQARLDNHTIASLASEFKAVREANLYLYSSVTEQQLLHKGIASNNVVSVRALLYMAAGHELHHLNVLQQKYL